MTHCHLTQPHLILLYFLLENTDITKIKSIAVNITNCKVDEVKLNKHKSNQSNTGQIYFISLISPDHILSDIISTNLTYSYLIKFNLIDPIWYNLIKYDPIRSKMISYHLVHFGRHRAPKIDRDQWRLILIDRRDRSWWRLTVVL